MNENLNEIQISGIRRFASKVKMVEGALSLTIGQPDFDMPVAVSEAMIRAIKEHKTVYTSNEGIVELRDEICRYLKNTFDIEYDKDEVCLTVGGSEGLFSVLNALLNPKDKILISSPAYPAYENIAKMIGAEVVNYGLNDDFTINIDEIREKIERDELADLIKKKNIVVITDEMYSGIIFDDYYSVAQIKEIKDKIIYVSGFSKLLSMTGIRVGYVACTEKYMKEIMKVHQYNVSCTSSIGQYGALEGLRSSLDDAEIMRKSFERRKNYCMKRLRDMRIEVNEPMGAFYIFPSIKKFNMTSEEFCEKLLNEEKLGCVPGNAFGKLGEGYMRISYCYSDEELKEAFDRLERFIKKNFPNC